MKKLIPLLFAAICCTTGIQAIGAHVSSSASGTSFQDDRTVKNFNGVAAGGPIQVIVTMGNTESIRFEGDAEAIATLVAEVKGNILIIRPQISWKSWAKKYEGKKIVAHVKAKNITSLSMSGDGSISVKGTVTASELTANLSGSGTIEATINADRLTGNVSGSGSVNITGEADEISANISGSGKIGGKNLSTKTLNAKVSGSGTAWAKVSGNINALISGSGGVYYGGNPSIEQKVIGSGGVSKF